MPTLTPAQLLDILEHLYQQVDSHAAALAQPLDLECRAGCTPCCVDDLRVGPAEASFIRAHAAPILAATPHPPGACAMLDDQGHCRIYPWRPYVCRTQGLPLRWLEEEDDTTCHEARDICPLNAPTVDLLNLPATACWPIGPMEQKLAHLDRSLDDNPRERTALRDLFTPTSTT